MFPEKLSSNMFCSTVNPVVPGNLEEVLLLLLLGMTSLLWSA